MKNQCYRITAIQEPMTNLESATFNSINHPDRPNFNQVNELLKSEPLAKGQKLILTIEKVSIQQCKHISK
jgi:hypothetical protein